METTRDNALEILHGYVESPALIRHCVAVEASMREYARGSAKTKSAGVL